MLRTKRHATLMVKNSETRMFLVNLPGRDHSCFVWDRKRSGCSRTDEDDEQRLVHHHLMLLVSILGICR